MKTALIALALVASTAIAQPRAVAMLGAHHADDRTYCDDGTTTELQSLTPGLGIGYDLNDASMAAAGIWRTSQSNAAPFAFIDWRPVRYRSLSAGLFGGVSGGYCVYENRLGPIGGLTVRLDYQRVALHVLYVPEFGAKKNTATLGAAVSIAF